MRLGRSGLIRVLIAVIVLAVAVAVFAGMRAHELRSGPSGDNLAVADPHATKEVTARVGAALKAVFSYDHVNLARTERAAKVALVGRAAEQYRGRFAEVADRAKRDKLVRSSSVRSIGVRELGEDRAVLLVFLDQQTFRPSRAPVSSTATLDVVAVRAGGEWRITEIGAL